MQHLDTVVDKRTVVIQQDDTTNTSAAASNTTAAVANPEVQSALSAEGFWNLASSSTAETVRSIVANEIPVGNSASILRAPSTTKTFARVLELYQRTLGSKQPKSSSPARNNKPSRPHLRGQKPVIVVPQGTLSVLTMANAHDFLCNSVYAPPQKSRPARTLRFTRHLKGHGLVEFEVCDQPLQVLGRSSNNNSHRQQWDRIVAVLVSGEEWQFQDWLAGYQTPAQLFHRCVGWYLGLEGESKAPPRIATWKVHTGWLHRTRRGLDSVTYTAFWNSVEEFMKVYKPELLPMHV